MEYSTSTILYTYILVAITLFKALFNGHGGSILKHNRRGRRGGRKRQRKISVQIGRRSPSYCQNRSSLTQRQPKTLVTIDTASGPDRNSYAYPVSIDQCIECVQTCDYNNNNLQVTQKQQEHRERKSNLRILSLNTRSVRNKRAELYELIETHKPDIILGTETWLGDEHKNAELFPETYDQIYRKDRNEHGGGVLIAVKSNLISNQLDADTNCEVVWTKICLTKGDIIVGCFYRPPSSGIESLEMLQESLYKAHNKIPGAKNIVIGGDFNLPDINWKNLSTRPRPQYSNTINDKMIDIVSEHGLTQVVNENTRKNNTLDIILTTCPDFIDSVQITPGMSDHDAVVCDIKQELRIQRKSTRTVWCYGKGNMNGIKDDLKTHYNLFEKESTNNDVNENWEKFKSIVLDSIEKHIPKKRISGRPNLPWMTSSIKRLIRIKQRRYNKAKINGRKEDWDEFRKIRQTVHTELKKEHENYVNNMLDSGDKTTKRFWKYIKSQRKDASGIPVLRRPDGSEATETIEKCNILNQHYETVFTIEDKSLPNITGNNCIPTLPRIKVTTNGVVKQLESLDPSKASGPDCIPTRVLKECACETAPYLCFIYQQSLDQGQVPNDWKHARVTAVFKKGKRDVAANYRPVSLTSVACKILEHIIFHSIMRHYDQYNIIVDHQHGFRKNRSCETQLINTIEELSRSLDSGKQIDLLILDFAKAFDTVPHNRLLHKLEQSGIRDNESGNSDQNPQMLNKWFRNWLCFRTQEVCLDGGTSNKCNVVSGVPQGTVLGPLCFLIFINDLGSNLSPETKLKLFADDSLLFRTIENEGDAKQLQADLDSLTSWADTWHMQFHPSKSLVMSITNKKKPLTHEYRMMNQTLRHVSSVKYLGVNINSSLKWKEHVEHIAAKAKTTLGFIQRNLYKCPQKVKAQAYITLVRPLLEYACSVWDPNGKKEIASLEKVQRVAARFATNCRSHQPGCVTRALHSLGWEPLKTRREKARLKAFHKAVHNKSATIIPEYIRKPSGRYTTRHHSTSNFTVPYARTDSYKYSFFPRTIREWNRLPNEITESGDGELFLRVLEMLCPVNV